MGGALNRGGAVGREGGIAWVVNFCAGVIFVDVLVGSWVDGVEDVEVIIIGLLCC